MIEAEHATELLELPAGADEADFLVEAYQILTKARRAEIHEALCPNPQTDGPQLYLALYKTSRGDDSEEVEADAWEVTGNNSAAFAFVTDGFPS